MIPDRVNDGFARYAPRLQNQPEGVRRQPGLTQSALARADANPAIAAPPPSAFDAPAETAAPQDPAAQLDALKTSLTQEEKKQFLAQFGVSEKHLKKAKPQDIDNAFNQSIDALKKPGETKFTFKVDGKKYEAKIKLDKNSGELKVEYKEKKGFFGKLWDGIKKVGKIALTVASFIPGPVGVVARVANAVISSVGAFKKGDILGGIAGMAGAVAGGAGALAGKAVSGAAKTVSTIAGAVQKGATAAQGAIDAWKKKDIGAFLGAVATGASGVAGALGNTAGGVAKTMNQISEWATRGNTALQAAAAARNGDIIGALTTGSQLANRIAPNSRFADTFGRIANLAGGARNLQDAIRKGDVLGAVAAGAGFASNQVGKSSRAGDVLGHVSELAATADHVQDAVQKGDYFGAAQQVAALAGKELTDPKARRALARASEIFAGAGKVNAAIQGGDYWGAAEAASDLAGSLTGSASAGKVGKILAGANEVRAAVEKGDLDGILKAVKELEGLVRGATDDARKLHVPVQPEARRAVVL